MFSNGQLVNASDLNNFSVTTVTTSGALTVGGAATVATTLGVTGAATIGGALSVTGASTLTGAMTISAQPAFLAVAANQNNVTGDGTLYTVLFATEVFDQANNFASPTFTAPITGKYLFNVQVQVTGLTSSHTSVDVNLVTTGRTIASQLQRLSDFIADDTWTGSVSMLMPMTATDTASVQVVVAGGTLVADIVGANTCFSAHLVC